MTTTDTATETTDTATTEHWALRRNCSGVTHIAETFVDETTTVGGDRDAGIVSAARDGDALAIGELVEWALFDAHSTERIDHARWAWSAQEDEAFSTIGEPEKHRGLTATLTSAGSILIEDGGSNLFVVEPQDWDRWKSHDFESEEGTCALGESRFFDDWAQCGEDVEYSERWEVYRLA